MKSVLSAVSIVSAAVLCIAAITAAADLEDPDCFGGSCPFVSPDDDEGTNSMKNRKSDLSRASGHPDGDGDGECGIWLGPSPIKQAEEHGFGLGMFTGKNIPKGSTVEGLYGGPEIILPVYGSETIYESHPPLREYVWDEDNAPEVAVEYPIYNTALFIPGLAAIAPCTSVHFNLEIQGAGIFGDSRESIKRSTTSSNIHRTSPLATAGSFASRNNFRYQAVRDIVAGEELTVQCDDDNFNGGAYYLSRYNTLQDDRVHCVDRNFRVEPSNIAGAGQGLFAKRNLQANTTILTTPMIPLHRKEIAIENENVNSKQLLLNYCYGHPHSNLLLVPYGPLVNYINHGPSQQQVNAEIRWHPMSSQDTDELHPRQQHHHPELFVETGEKVAKTHGKGLMMDIVAIRPIEHGDEIYLDYGIEWQEAWEEHKRNWKPDEYDTNYINAEYYNEKHQTGLVPFRTVAEQEHEPYPETVETFCFYKRHKKFKGTELQRFSWMNDASHRCFRPCDILERQANDQEGNELHYTVMLRPEHDDRVVGKCVIESTYILDNVPSEAIRIVDRPFTTDVLLKEAFRHEIGVPQGFYPDIWMKKKLRGRKDKAASSNGDGDEFKRKSMVEMEVKAG